MATRQEEFNKLTGCDLSSVKVLVVGAGGIGCELVKNLVLSGFSHIQMIDLDTIDYSNLNRQFLFRAKHVGRSKAEVARESVLDFPHDEQLAIVAEHGNIKEQRFGFEFFEQFSIVLNALDNADARRHVNRLCLATKVPLVESGTEGYKGQVRAIVKGETKCFECDPPAPQKTYPVCTIRNHPDKPVHCITWAKELLFGQIFGGEETDLIDTSEEGAGGEEGEGGDGVAPAEVAAEGAPAAPPLLKLQEGEAPAAFARRVFATVFHDNVQLLLSMDSLWKERTPPQPLRVEEMALPAALTLAEVETRPWTAEENAAVLLHTIETMLTTRAEEVGCLKFDKDDPDALDFVTAAANLRSENFHIPTLSRWDVKEIAGNIIPAIATTNAIIAGFIVLEAVKLLRGALAECRYVNCNRIGSGRKRDTLLAPSKIDPPNESCVVCQGVAGRLTVDCKHFTVGDLIDKVVKKRLSFNKPTIDAVNAMGDEDQIAEGMEEECDEEEIAKYARYRDITLAALPKPLGSGSKLMIDDVSQKLEVTMELVDAVLDPEECPDGFRFEGGGAKPAAEDAPAASGGGEDVADAPASKRQRVDDVDDCVILD